VKIFSSAQIKEIDGLTIKNEPIASIDLMERAALQLFHWITRNFERSEHFVIFAGPGNNGGDGLALARMLATNRYDTEVHFVNLNDKTSHDWGINRKRLETETTIRFNEIKGTDHFPSISKGDVIIDAIFGTGLTRPAGGLAAEVIRLINISDAIIISIDIPSGLYSEDNSSNSYESVIRAEYTLSFHFPKLSFMFAENAPYLGDWHILPIGLDQKAVGTILTPFYLLENSDISPFLKKRSIFDHKGIFGHGLLISGSKGKMGAAILGSGAALRTGIGLLTCHIPSCGSSIIQCSFPEAMIHVDESEDFISDTGDIDIFNSIGIGPGIGLSSETQIAVHSVITRCKVPMVIDADALNIISLNKKWLLSLPEGTILTPHPKEFERLAGKTANSYLRLLKQIEFSKVYNCIVVLKGAHTSVTTPDGKVIFNNTGNPGMATAGSGDVLPGIILSLLAQGYTPEHAAVLGVYLHGLAGDMAASENCFESIIASDIIKFIGKAFNKIRELKS
jgi:hydroxyethylthiazole kinase-like uncharacterized protein yjeF